LGKNGLFRNATHLLPMLVPFWHDFGSQNVPTSMNISMKTGDDNDDDDHDDGDDDGYTHGYLRPLPW
jgi:hypothetical protein